MIAIALMARGRGVYRENGEAVSTGGELAFDLVVRKSTYVSQPLRNAVLASSGGKVWEILEDKND